ncbi:MAG: cytochrome P450 [Gemmatimonadota bacterium]|nr:cytochrome P450 [Gemmatimonadota bacterium]
MATILRPPGPKGVPLLGNLPDFGRDTLGFLTQCAREYGDIVSLRLGGWPTLLISHPEFAEYVLVKHHRNFVKNTFFWRHVRRLFGTGLLTNEGDSWLSQRRLAAPAFHTQRLNSYAEVMVGYTERMLEQWSDGEVRDLHEDMMGLTMRIAAKTLFDADVTEDVEEVDRAVEAVLHEIAARFRRPVFVPDLVPIPGNIRYLRGIRRLDALVTRVIRSRMASGEDRGDLLSMLLAARDDDGRGMSEQQLRDEVITLFLAGHETTALTLSWTWHLLTQHPAVEAKLAAEVEEVVGERSPRLEELPSLTYTEQVVKESMRLYPPAWAIGREAVEACEIGGYPVPAGTTILISPWVIHRDPRFFDRPEEFLPERWSNGFEKDLPRFAYLPFGGGPRICIGNRFAMMEAVLLLATITRCFRLVGQPDHPVVPYPTITLRPEGGVRVKVARRDRVPSAETAA